MHRFKLFVQFLNSNSCNYVKLRSFSTRFQNAGPMACHLKSRSVIRFKGPDTIKFLQGLVTNDVRSLNEVSAGSDSFPTGTPNMSVIVVPPVYAALLTSQGRFLYDMFLYRPPRSDEMLDRTGTGPGSIPGEFELFADVDSSVLDELLETLKKYRLRSKVDIECLADDFSVWQRFGSNLAAKSSPTEEPEAKSVGWGGKVDPSGVSASHGNKCGWQWNKDPRLECLGFRGIFSSDTTPPLVEADKETDEENYILWRFEKGVAEGPAEIPKGEAMPLEYNFAGLNAISFDKGCYVGQELIARTHHRGVIRKRLLPLRFFNDTGNEVGVRVSSQSKVIDRTSQKKVGTVTAALGSCGLGLLRLEEAFNQSGSLSIEGHEDVKVEVYRPEWWPTEWSSDYQQKSAAA